MRLAARYTCRLALLFALGLCHGCGLLPHGGASQAPEPQRFRFADGGEAIYFVLDKSLALEQPSGPGRHIETFLFVVSGSDCASMAYFLPQYFRGLEGESGPLRIFVLHKRHIGAYTWGRMFGCSEEFIRDDHPSRWIADQTEFIGAQLRQARQRSAAPRRIVIAGISEGAEIVPALARTLPDLTHAVLVANGGLDPIEAYRLQARRHGFVAALQALDRMSHAPPSDPDAPEYRIGGRTWRYWDELQRLNYAQGLLELQMPLMVGMGEADQAVPIEAAWRLRQAYAAAGKNNLRMLTFPGADHALQAPDGNRMPDFWHAVDLWLLR